MNDKEHMFDFDLVEREFDSRILSYASTLEKLRDPAVSMARFGDSEIKMVSENFSIGFQKFSTALQEQLLDVISMSSPEFMIGFPPVFRNEQWSRMWNRLYEPTKELFRDVTAFANTAVSRPPCFNELKEQAVEGWISLWEGKRVVVVTGKGSRFELYDDFFGNAGEIDVVYGEAIDAFEHLDAVVKELQSRKTADVYLLSLGPAATVLAGVLHNRGVKALDVGHLSASYAYFRGKGLYPEKMAIVRDGA